MMYVKLLLLLILVSELGAVQLLISWISTIKLLDSEHPSNITSATGSTFLSVVVDYHYKRGEIYYSDGLGRINRAWLGDEAVKKVPLVIAQGSIIDLAVDWVNDNLYWTDGSRMTLEMATLDGLNRRVLLNASDGLGNPRAIVVDPSERLLFWSDWSNGEILSSGLDGKGMKTVASNFKRPNGLTMDLDGKKLYIIDADLNSLYSCNYDGSNMKVLLANNDLVQLAFSLTYFSNKLYWTSWKESRLISLDIATKHIAVIYKIRFGTTLEVEGMNGVKAIHPSLQPDVPQANACNDKHCSHQCLPSTASCMCPFGFTLGQDEKTCVEEGYMLVSWMKTIQRYDLQGNREQPMLNPDSTVTSIDVHLKKRLVFWSVIEEQRVYRAPLSS